MRWLPVPARGLAALEPYERFSLYFLATVRLGLLVFAAVTSLRTLRINNAAGELLSWFDFATVLLFNLAMSVMYVIRTASDFLIASTNLQLPRVRESAEHLHQQKQPAVPKRLWTEYLLLLFTTARVRQIRLLQNSAFFAEALALMVLMHWALIVISLAADLPTIQQAFGIHGPVPQAAALPLITTTILRLLPKPRYMRTLSL